ncbi:MAG: GxxExxY protein [Prevotellaceae bacterium]|jgi:GxxExxY protein|nr:GxxExxY protein [Prevotellaceae bacterium]
MNDNVLTETVIGCAIKVHRALGPGLLEHVYQECLYYKLTKEGLFAEKEKPMPVIFEEVKLDCGFRLDLVVEKSVIVECKSIKALDDVHTAQILTYLKLSDITTGLLINFNVTLLKNGIKRIKNGY